MSSTHLSLADVASFGATSFADFSTQKISYDFELIQALVATPNNPFPVNRYGNSPIPHKLPTVEAVLFFKGDAGAANPHVDLDSQVRAFIDQWLSATGGLGGLAGHTDTLKIWNADHSGKWQATAFLAKAPVTSQAGQNWRHVLITCTWVLLGTLSSGG